MTNENRNWIIVVAALTAILVIGGVMLSSALNPPVRIVVKEVIVTPSSTTSTTIVQVNEWCLFLDKWALLGPTAAAEEWVFVQEPWAEPQFAMIEFALCGEFGKEMARLIWPLYIGE